MIAEIGTPCGFSHSFEMLGHCRAGAVNRELGCAAGARPVQGLPRQSIRFAGGAPSVMPSHQGSLLAVSATLVKMLLLCIVAIALGLVSALVPGATPKKPASGFIAHSRPSGPMRIQAMSSPTVQTR